MRRESDEGFVCPLCMETVFRGHCGCPDPEEHGQNDRLGQDALQQLLASAYTISKEEKQ
jgi:hypothetical protein